MHKIKDRERNQIINALRAGVVPNVGLRHIQVGRAKEITAIGKDIEHICSGGSTVRFVTGEFGSGKSFFITLTKLMAHEKKLVVLNADITTDRILCASDGKARNLLSELLRNLSHKNKPEGGGLKSVVETWISKFRENNPDPNENSFYSALMSLTHLPLCQPFAKVLYLYLKGFRDDDINLMEKCLKWFRAEYSTKTEAKDELGVSKIIEDGDFYDALKLYAGFCRLAGFSGLLVEIDELAVLIRQRAPQRNKNYETLLRIINDCLQGTVENIGFIFGATLDAIENKEKGLFSYGALETRLSSNRYANGAIADLSGPVLGLSRLTKEEIFVLLHRLSDIHSNFEAEHRVLPEEGIQAFFNQVYSRLGSETHLNPRDVIREFLGLLSVLEQHKDKTWRDLLPSIHITPSADLNEGLVDILEE